MSTRSNILFKHTVNLGKENPNNGVKIHQVYKHHDGYPMGTGLELIQKILKFIDEKEVKDVNSSCFFDHWFKYEFTQNWEYEGTEKNLHGDIEYLYEVDFDNGLKVSCYKRDYKDSNNFNYKTWKKTVLLSAYEMDYLGKKLWNVTDINVSNSF